MTPRPLDLLDLPTLYRYRAEAVSLDSARMLTRGNPLGAAGFMSYFNLARHLYTAVSQENGATMLGGVIQNNGAALHLFSGGAGTIRLNATNTYSGGTTIAAGTLSLGNNAVTGDAANLGTGSVANFGTLIIDKTAVSTTVANNISGTGSLTINRGNLTLSGTNTYSGDTNVLASTTVTAGSATALSSDSRMVLNAASATLDLAALSGSVAALRGDQAAAAVLISGGTLTLSGSDKARPGSTDNTLSTVPQVYQGGISGAGSLIKNGAYTQQFTGAGVVGYTGATTINAGTLQTTKAFATAGVTVNGSGAFVSDVAGVVSNTVPVNLAGSAATWTISNTFNQSVGSLIGATGARVELIDAGYRPDFLARWGLPDG